VAAGRTGLPRPRPVAENVKAPEEHAGRTRACVVAAACRRSDQADHARMHGWRCGTRWGTPGGLLRGSPGPPRDERRPDQCVMASFGFARRPGVVLNRARVRGRAWSANGPTPVGSLAYPSDTTLASHLDREQRLLQHSTGTSAKPWRQFSRPSLGTRARDEGNSQRAATAGIRALDGGNMRAGLG
jgi:hypothetical protein